MFLLYGMCEWNPQRDRWEQINLFPVWITQNKERVRIFGKSSVDIQGLIKVAIDVDVTVFSSSEIFICTANCYRRLIRFEKNSNNLCNLKKRNQKDYENGGSGVRTKRLRKETTTCLEAQMDSRTSVISLGHSVTRSFWSLHSCHEGHFVLCYK